MLRRVVGCRSREDALGGDRKIVHDRASALHHGERGLRHEEEAVEVGVDHFHPGGIGQLADAVIGMSNARVVDEDIEGRVQSADKSEEVVDRVGAADVARLRQDLQVQLGRLELLQYSARLGQGTFVAAGDDEVASFARQRSRDGETDAAVGAGDKGEVAGERGAGRHRFAKYRFAFWHVAFFSLCQARRSYEPEVCDQPMAVAADLELR